MAVEPGTGEEIPALGGVAEARSGAAGLSDGELGPVWMARAAGGATTIVLKAGTTEALGSRLCIALSGGTGGVAATPLLSSNELVTARLLGSLGDGGSDSCRDASG